MFDENEAPKGAEIERWGCLKCNDAEELKGESEQLGIQRSLSWLRVSVASTQIL